MKIVCNSKRYWYLKKTKRCLLKNILSEEANPYKTRCVKNQIKYLHTIPNFINSHTSATGE